MHNYLSLDGLIKTFYNIYSSGYNIILMSVFVKNNLFIKMP